MTDISEVTVPSGPGGERQSLTLASSIPSKEVCLANAKAGWEVMLDDGRMVAKNLADAKSFHQCSLREMAEATGIPKSTIQKLIRWVANDFPRAGPFSRAPQIESNEGEGRQPGQGQRQPSRAQREITSLKLETPGQRRAHQ